MLCAKHCAKSLPRTTWLTPSHNPRRHACTRLCTVRSVHHSKRGKWLTDMSTKAELVKCLYIYPHNAVRCVDIKTTEVDLHRRQRTISKITTVTGKQARYRSFVHSCVECVCTVQRDGTESSHVNRLLQGVCLRWKGNSLFIVYPFILF